MDATAAPTLRWQQLHDRRAASLSTASRDPRAASVSFRRNVSSPESCEFYGAADAISGCRVPRSCQDCLAMPGCGITLGGQCRNATSASDAPDAFDFRNVTFNNDSRVSLTSQFYFNADTARYCAASDPVCVACRAAFERLDRDGVAVKTQFCKGDSGCVCIAICEVPTERAPNVLDTACGQPIWLTKPVPKPQRESDSVATRGDPRVPVVKMDQTSKVPEMCAYTSQLDVRGCRRPRTCRSCLERPGCELWNAKCEESQDYNWIRDFRTTQFINSSERSLSADKYFPSSNTSYCSALDSRCTACRKQWKEGDDSSWAILMSNSTFCVGQDGCVCIEACESELWATGVIDTECLQLEKPIDTLNGGSSAAIFIAVFIVLWCFY